MAGYNRIIIVGNLTRDPEYKQIANGQAVCRLGLASNRPFKNRQTGATSQEVCYVDIDVWGAQAESCRQYLSKGRPVLVEGRLKFDTWQDQQGATRSKHSIAADRVVFLASAASEQAQEGEVEQGGSDSFSSGSVSAPNYTTQNTQEFAKIEQTLAKKQASKKAATVKSKDGESVVFKDEAPFEDELPF